MIYDYKHEKLKKAIKGKATILVAVIALIVLLVIASSIYLEIVQLEEIGKNFSKVYLINLACKLVSFGAAFLFIFAALSISGIFIRKNARALYKLRGLSPKKLPVFSLSAGIALAGAWITRDLFSQKALNFLHSTSFGKTDPIFLKDVGYYVFERPFLMSMLDFISGLAIFTILYTAVYYMVVLLTIDTNLTLESFKVKTILRHNLINIGIFFLLKSITYRFVKEGILYNSVVGYSGAGYIDDKIWRLYYTFIPFVIVVIVAVAFVFLWKGRIKHAAISIAAFPAIWLLVSVSALLVQSLLVTPNEKDYESPYLAYHIEKTREAFGIDDIRSFEFSDIKELTTATLEANQATRDNIRIVDYEATLQSDRQLQAIKPYYNFHDGDIINLNINGDPTPVFITARELDKSNIPEKSYINRTFRYTHGYGIVINPIHSVNTSGQVNFLMSELSMKSPGTGLQVTQPRIYYGEIAKDHVVVGAANNLKEIDYDGETETNYEGNGGIQLNFLNRLLFSLKYQDFNMLISGYVKDSKLLLNRQVVERARKAVPFLTVDPDPYIVPSADGGLKWVLDAYTTSTGYPYSQNFSGVNYIRNSVKIVVDAYHGTVDYYIIDKEDPMIQTYHKIYPGLFKDQPLPEDISASMKYPELLFKIQTEVLKKYHVEPKDVSAFYSNQDMWDIAKYPADRDSTQVRDIDAYYNMIRLPGDFGGQEEFILMRPFTPANKHNMISWLAVRNSPEHYGELILFKFSNDTNVFGPYQVEAKINQIDSVSKDITLWGQSGSDVFKGSLLVIPIQDSILYVEPIYIRSSGQSSTPEIKQVIVGYQRGDEFVYGIGTNLDSAMANLFGKAVINPPATQTPQVPPVAGGDNKDKDQVLSDLISKYDEIKKQLDELGSLIDELR